MNMVEKTEQYLSHLARFQYVNAADGAAWRVFVQPIGQEEPLYFPDLAHYFEFVEQETKMLVLNRSETAVYPPSTVQETPT
jgi:hypothetical protein